MSDFLKTLPQYVIPQKLLTRMMGKLASAKRPKWAIHFAIRKFIQHYGVNMLEAIETDYKKYVSFNDFFTRKLDSQLRPIENAQSAIVSPADGCISEIGKINGEKLLQAKGHLYTIKNLLGGNHEEAQWFENGHFATIYLSPKDYHRVHIPYAGHFIKQQNIPGKLFSVNSRTTRVVPNLFARNERVITLFQTAQGKMAVIMVGAMIVGNIVITGKEDTVMEKGEELGYFQLGSTAIILFEANQLVWDDNMRAGSTVRMGQSIGRLVTI